MKRPFDNFLEVHLPDLRVELSLLNHRVPVSQETFADAARLTVWLREKLEVLREQVAEYEEENNVQV